MYKYDAKYKRMVVIKFYVRMNLKIIRIKRHRLHLLSFNALKLETIEYRIGLNKVDKN